MASNGANTTFPWDYDVPATPFWSGLDFTVGRNFLTCFTPSKVEQMRLDPTLDRDKRLHLLLTLLQQKLAARDAEVAPARLHSLDFNEWQRLMIGIETMQKFLGLPEEEDTIRIIMENGKDDKRNMSGVNMMAGFKERHGQYAEAEVLAREVLPFMQNSEMLGVDSPQALGTTRTIISCLWKQGRFEEAQKLVDETLGLIGRMGEGKFEKYQEDERDMLLGLVGELEDWGSTNLTQ